MRFRNRLEFQVPLNREKVSDDGARYLLADWEWFIPLSDPAERFASRQRVRAGLGYRAERRVAFRRAVHLGSLARHDGRELSDDRSHRQLSREAPTL